MPVVQGLEAGVAVQSAGCRTVYPCRGETNVAVNSGTGVVAADDDFAGGAEAEATAEGPELPAAPPPTALGPGRPRRSTAPPTTRTPTTAAVAIRGGTVMSGN